MDENTQIWRDALTIQDKAYGPAELQRIKKLVLSLAAVPFHGRPLAAVVVAHGGRYPERLTDLLSDVLEFHENKQHDPAFRMSQAMSHKAVKLFTELGMDAAQAELFWHDTLTMLLDIAKTHDRESAHSPKNLPRNGFENTVVDSVLKAQHGNADMLSNFMLVHMYQLALVEQLAPVMVGLHMVDGNGTDEHSKDRRQGCIVKILDKLSADLTPAMLVLDDDAQHVPASNYKDLVLKLMAEESPEAKANEIEEEFDAEIKRTLDRGKFGPKKQEADVAKILTGYLKKSGVPQEQAASSGQIFAAEVMQAKHTFDTHLRACVNDRMLASLGIGRH